jgi:hypothetical protein
MMSRDRNPKPTPDHSDDSASAAPPPSRSGGSDLANGDDGRMRIAELVRRAQERQAATGASVGADPTPVADATPVQPLEVQPTQVVQAPGAEPTQVQAAAAEPTQVQAAVAEPTQVQPVVADPTLVHAPVADPTQAMAPTEPPAAAPGPTSTRESTAGRFAALPSRRVLVAAAVVLALIVVGIVAFSGGSGTGTSTPAPSTQAGQALPGYALRVSDTVTDCASHARGLVARSLRDHPCVKATRSLATGQVDGREVLVVTSRIEMPSARDAARVKRALDGNGTGNVNDLLREGRTFAGAPARMPTSGYASRQAGSMVVVAEVGYLHGQSSDADPALRAAAAQVASTLSAHG